MLDSRQAAHVLANRAKMRQGRLRTVTLIRKSGGETTYTAAECTWKEEHNTPPGAAKQQGRPGGSGPDVLAEFLPDVDFSEVVAIADTPDRDQVAAARKYRVQESLRLGLTATPNRILVKLVAIR
ncbi:MAG: hypothetical protein F4X83_01195 [Chloroflexi bacterium]|nr:hypothetical protein [Chloroflexota bacterium]